MTDAEQALWAFEAAVEGVLSFVKGGSYGLRLAEKRLGDMTTRGQSPGELELLVASLEQAPDQLSDLVVLALGDHLRAFLARALDLSDVPSLPDSVQGLETMAGVPGALRKASPWVPLLLQLYRVALRGGKLDQRALEALGGKELEIPFPGGKVKLFRQGDRVTLTEQLLDEMGRSLVEAAKAIHLRLITA